MFDWFKEKNTDQYIGPVEAYIKAHYQDPTRKQFSKPVKSVTDAAADIDSGKTQVNRSRRVEPAGDSSAVSGQSDGRMYSDRYSDVRFSSTDNYDSGTIRNAISSFAAFDSPDETLSILDKYTNMSFVSKLKEYISRKNLRDSDVYKAAQIDRRLFSKIITDFYYKPSKDTCIALCYAMELTLSETEDLLSRAGFALSHSSKRDVILEYFFREGIYDVSTVNDVLFRLDQKTLGRA